EDARAWGLGKLVWPPRFPTASGPTQNRLAVLVETHSWKDYAARVRITRDAAEGLVELAAKYGSQWREAAQQADEADRKPESRPLPLAFETTGKSTQIKFPGYAYTREPSDISGGQWTRYDIHKPQVW